MPDLFTPPYPLVPDVVIDISGQLDTIVAMLACHKSQVFEFLPVNFGVAAQVPDSEAERRDWLREWYKDFIRPRADRFREALIKQYGDSRGNQVEWAEAFEISEYAAPLEDEARGRLFEFLYEPDDSRDK